MRVTAPLCAALAHALPERPFRVELWDGSTLPPTNGAGGPTFRLRSPRALGHVLRAPGQLGLGRAYVSGELDVDDMDAVLELLDGYDVPPLDAPGKARLAAVAERAESLAGAERMRVWRLYLRAARRGFEDSFTSIFQIVAHRPQGRRQTYAFEPRP
jgi:cyclopropane-fatty-acyl-phospholipid synthase